MIINNLEWALSIVRPKRVRVDPALLHLVEKAVNYPAIRAMQAYASFQARDRAAAGHGLWPDRNCCRNRPSATVNIHMIESNVTAILGECLSCRIWSENHQRLPLPSASVGCRDFTIMPNIMVRPRLRENRRCVSGRTFDGVHMRSSLLCQSVRSGRDCEHRSNDSSFSGPTPVLNRRNRIYTNLIDIFSTEYHQSG